MCILSSRSARLNWNERRWWGMRKYLRRDNVETREDSESTNVQASKIREWSMITLTWRLLRDWRSDDTRRTCDRCSFVIVFANDSFIWMLRSSNVERRRLIERFDEWLWSIESIQIIVSLRFFPWVRVEKVHNLNLELHTDDLNESIDFLDHDNVIIKYERIICSTSEERPERWSEIHWEKRAHFDCRQSLWMNSNFLCSRVARGLTDEKILWR